MKEKVLILTEQDVLQAVQNPKFDIIDEVEHALVIHIGNQVMVPDKISQVFNQKTQERINCMPATLLSEKVSGVKWVSVFPPNIEKGRDNVSGSILLSELEYGTLLAVVSATLLTTMRTAAVGAVAAKYLAKKDVSIIGFIGSGEEAKMHLIMICKVHKNIRHCKVASRRPESEIKFIKELSNLFPDIQFEACKSDYEKSVRGSDIVVTATSCQEELLKAEWIEAGMLYIHVGGLEDEFGVSEKATKIVCDDWEAVKHRTQTISRRYKQGLLKDDEIHGNLGNIISGKIVGREFEEEFIYFNSVGLATIDIYLAKCIYQIAKEQCRGAGVDMSCGEELVYKYLV